jgi:hypothetical protein
MPKHDHHKAAGHHEWVAKAHTKVAGAKGDHEQAARLPQKLTRLPKARTRDLKGTEKVGRLRSVSKMACLLAKPSDSAFRRWPVRSRIVAQRLPMLSGAPLSAPLLDDWGTKREDSTAGGTQVRFWEVWPSLVRAVAVPKKCARHKSPIFLSAFRLRHLPGIADPALPFLKHHDVFVEEESRPVFVPPEPVCHRILLIQKGPNSRIGKTKKTRNAVRPTKPPKGN